MTDQEYFKSLGDMSLSCWETFRERLLSLTPTQLENWFLHACHCNNITAVGELIARGADVSMDSYSVLVRAALNGHQELFAFLLTHAKPSNVDLLRMLVASASSGDDKIFDMLIDRGVSPDANVFVISTATQTGFNLLSKIIQSLPDGVPHEWLLLSGKFASREGMKKLLTLLPYADDELLGEMEMSAAKNGNANALSVLLEHGVDVVSLMQEKELEGVLSEMHTEASFDGVGVILNKMVERQGEKTILLMLSSLLKKDFSPVVSEALQKANSTIQKTLLMEKSDGSGKSGTGRSGL